MMAKFTTTHDRSRIGCGRVLMGKRALICEGFVNQLPRTAWLPHEFPVQQRGVRQE